ncbi:hypothetical protein LSG31_19885 [Fodinisporobacter ferrooxydans]|uniref:Uncharacterized protein n=1 Tax=Fodinisporobacter ferrooxydans TaxID=2901836 RepID=A0ABY4CI64_9BACL|nr:hypothetical protein LSG31_19885 [Alicyclobacillaceae bacterium MYW30-H2]
MIQTRDIMISIILIVGSIYILYRMLAKKAARVRRLAKKQGNKAVPAKRSTELEALLASHGYESIQPAERHLVNIQYGDKEISSSFQIDGLAEKADKLYVVKKRLQKPGNSRLNGVSIRQELFPLFLLYQADGVLFVNIETGHLTKVSFDFEHPLIDRKKRVWKKSLGWFLTGLVLGISLVLSKKS